MNVRAAVFPRRETFHGQRFTGFNDPARQGRRRCAARRGNLALRGAHGVAQLGPRPPASPSRAGRWDGSVTLELSRIAFWRLTAEFHEQSITADGVAQAAHAPETTMISPSHLSPGSPARSRGGASAEHTLAERINEDPAVLGLGDLDLKRASWRSRQISLLLASSPSRSSSS